MRWRKLLALSPGCWAKSLAVPLTVMLAVEVHGNPPRWAGLGIGAAAGPAVGSGQPIGRRRRAKVALVQGQGLVELAVVFVLHAPGLVVDHAAKVPAAEGAVDAGAEDEFVPGQVDGAGGGQDLVASGDQVEETQNFGQQAGDFPALHVGPRGDFVPQNGLFLQKL